MKTKDFKIKVSDQLIENIKGQRHVTAANNLDDRNPPPPHLHPSHPSGRPKVMQHADPKSIDLSPSFKRDSAPLPPLPLLFPGVRWWVFVCFHAALMFFDLSVCRGRRMAVGPIRVQDGPVPWRLCPPCSLSKSLGPNTFLIALVIWLLCHELCLMTTTLQWGLNCTKGRRADRLFG